MITKFILSLRILPRWVIILLDVIIVAISTGLGYALRFNFEVATINNYNPFLGILVNSVACVIALLLTKSYAGIVRYTGLKDGLRVFQTLVLTHSLSSLFNIFIKDQTGRNIIPYSVILISFLASFLFLFQYRLLIKNIFSYYSRIYSKKLNIAIFGAGQMGIVTKHLLDDGYRSDYQVTTFFEDDQNKVGKEINGTYIYSFSKFEEVIDKHNIQELIIAVNKLSIDRKNEIVDICLNHNIKVRTVPDLNSWVQGELSINQIKEVKIDDLLERDSIRLMNTELIEQIKSKVVLITGGAGSIGGELVNQVLSYNPQKIIIIDQAESALYDLLIMFGDKIDKIHPYVADITNYARIREIFLEHKPELIYHAAAYKHVPLMEENPSEAVSCNIIGTKNVADLAVYFEAEKFVMVSTDKAVNPTNVMGASKRVAEMYVQSINALKRKTIFITTRFGNVLGSNGSVIPHFKKQIERGGPLTVTHPEITRYFMTIGEACQLILEAGCMGRGGEIFLFDMGRSVKIVDLAKKMIRLSGYEPFKDIDIIYTGLRQGEKLYEELLADKENSLPTHHDKILIAQVSVPEFAHIEKEVRELQVLVDKQSSLALVAALKRIVPEFVSNRSIYEVLDKEK